MDYNKFAYFEIDGKLFSGSTDKAGNLRLKLAKSDKHQQQITEAEILVGKSVFSSNMEKFSNNIVKKAIDKTEDLLAEDISEDMRDDYMDSTAYDSLVNKGIKELRKKDITSGVLSEEMIEKIGKTIEEYAINYVERKMQKSIEIQISKILNKRMEKEVNNVMNDNLAEFSDNIGEQVRGKINDFLLSTPHKDDIT